jgi:hypothetical protein
MTDAVLARWEYVRDAPRAPQDFVLRGFGTLKGRDDAWMKGSD